MLKEEQDKIKETLSISDKISDILSKELDVGSQHVLDSWLAQNEQNKALFNKICSEFLSLIVYYCVIYIIQLR